MKVVGRCTNRKLRIVTRLGMAFDDDDGDVRDGFSE